MKKGSKARKCCNCGKIIGWIVPTNKKLGFISFVDFKPNDEFAPHEGRYICKECVKKEIEQATKVFLSY